MTKKKRNILLFIDNCTAHNIIPNMESVSVIFLPPNTTSKLQPLDQGIIKNFKVMYRTEVVRHVLKNMESNAPNAALDVLQAMRFVDKSWRNVTESTIVNCFRTCGFDQGSTSTDDKEMYNNLTEEEWLQLLQPDKDNEFLTFEDYVTLDNDVAVTGVLPDQEIVAQISS